MPTYEYSCKSCGNNLEIVQSFSDTALTVCPSCGGELRKLFGSIGIAFKGSGFYKTDSRAGTATKKETGDTNPDSTKSDPKTADTKTDAKPAEKPAATPIKSDAPSSSKPTSDAKPTTTS